MNVQNVSTVPSHIDDFIKGNLEQLNKIDLHIDNLNKQIELLKKMQIGLAIKINKDGKS